MASDVKKDLDSNLQAMLSALGELGITPESIDVNRQNAPIEAALGASIGTREEIPGVELGDNELFDAASKVALQLMSGEVPPDVKQTLERYSAEIATQGGLGMSQAATNLQAKDLGLTSLNLKTSGADLALGIGQAQERSKIAQAELNVGINQFNENQKTTWNALEVENNRWRATFSLGLGELDLAKDKGRLAIFDLISRNQTVAQTLINDLIINNSQSSIEGIDQNLEKIKTNLAGLNEEIAESFSMFDDLESP